MEFPGDYDPTDLDAAEQREAERQRELYREAAERRDHIKWMLSGERGRREMRRQLSATGFDVTIPFAPDLFDRHAGEMARNVGLSAPGLQLIWTLLLMAARGDVPFSQFQALFTETLNDDRDAGGDRP